MAPTITANDDRLIEHWTALRSNLHDPTSWCNQPDISLTYVPTLSGFSGPAQRDHYCGVNGPAARHPFHPSTSNRFNNRLQRISIHIDQQRAMITEELTLSVLHAERMDWLLPGQEETRKVLNVQMVVIGRLDCEQPHLLHTVRVYWEQAGVWKESGLLARALQGAARAGVKGFDEQVTLEQQLTIPDGARVNVRLTNPTPFNCNQLTPLDQDYLPSPSLTTMTTLLHELPVDQKNVVKPREHPAFKEHNAIVGDEVLLKSCEEFNQKLLQSNNNPVFKTTMEFKDDFEPTPIDPKVKSHRLENIFDDPNPQYRPTISIDPMRNKSFVFGGDNHQNVITTSVKIDTNRLASSGLISSMDEPKKETSNIHILNPNRFKSQITAPEQDIIYVANEPKAVQKEFISHIHHGQSMEDTNGPLVGNVDPNRFQSNINFAALNESPETIIKKTVNTSHNDVLLGLGDQSDSNGKRNHKANTSSIMFDFDNPQTFTEQPSTRYQRLYY